MALQSVAPFAKLTKLVKPGTDSPKEPLLFGNLGDKCGSID